MSLPRRRLPALTAVLMAVAFALPSPLFAGETGCRKCHGGIEDIRDPDSEMMRRIREAGTKVGDPDGCTVCHGGNVLGATAVEAHGGEFYPDPGSPWINDRTCGRCHAELVRAQWRSLMMTEAGKIQGTAWSAGGMTGYTTRWGNHDVRNPSDPHQALGTAAYRAYRERLARLEPGAFPDSLAAVPAAPTGVDAVRADPRQATFTYIRSECQRCHLGVRGRQKRGDYRGLGCTACHVPYSNEGLYEGSDTAIPRDEPGHPLVHRIQATRQARVTVHGHTYSGIPVETCTTCHDRGKRIGTSFQGLMESAYHSPWGDDGTGQPGLHSKHYISMQGDVHNTRYRMVCQDCHTTLDVHGDGRLAGTTLAAVEIECTDCHGTPRRFPWELPLGYGDEFGRDLPDTPRGVADTLLPTQRLGTVYPREDGYLLSARGNPLGNVVRRGDRVVVHTAGGRDLDLAPLKLLAREDSLGLAARVAMVSVGKHIDAMECYTCHAQWAPQCYGCHVKIDYSGGRRSYDWVAASQAHREAGVSASALDPPADDVAIPGRVSEQRSYLRWENPALGVNGEGRITPIIPGCQVSYTVVDSAGHTVVRDTIYRTPPGTEGGGPRGQLSLDMAPVQPHTNGRARSCESCHADPKAAGYGIAGGRLTGDWSRGRVVDLAAPDGTVLPAAARSQIAPIAGLTDDWSRVVTEDGRQLQTVGHHFRLSRPLDNTERGLLERQGLCLGCHREIPRHSPAVNLLHHVAAATGQLPITPRRHADLLHKILLLAGWVQVLLPVIVLALGVLWWRRRRRSHP